MEREMESGTPSIIDLNAELAKLTMFRGRTPQSTMADREGSGARLAAFRDGALFTTKFAGKGHWESHLTGDELIQSRRHREPGNRARGRAAIFRAPCWNDR